MALIQSSQASDALDYWRNSISIAIRPKGRRKFCIACMSRIARNSEHRSVRRLAALRLAETKSEGRAA